MTCGKLCRVRLNYGIDVPDLIKHLHDWETELQRASYPTYKTEDFWRPIADAFERSGESISEWRAMDLWYENKVENIEEYLTYALADDELISNLLTERYWNIISVIKQGELASVQGGFGLACRHQSKVLGQFRLQLEAVAACARGEGTVVVPDTNVFAHCGTVYDIDWLSHASCDQVRIIVPHVVIDELDELKWTGRDKDVRLQVRAAIKALRSLTGGKPPGSAAFVRDGVSLAILPDQRGHVRLPSNDEEICDRALLLQQFTRPVVLATNDMGMHVRAHAFDLKVIEVPDISTTGTG
jgi:rRNA-processing protein FCF1